MSAIVHCHIFININGYRFEESLSQACTKTCCEESLLKKILKILQQDLAYAPIAQDNFSALCDGDQKKHLYTIAKSAKVAYHQKRAAASPYSEFIVDNSPKDCEDLIAKRLDAKCMQIRRFVHAQPFLPFPNELIQQVLQYLNLMDLLRVSQVNLHAFDHCQVVLLKKANFCWYNEAIHITPSQYFKCALTALDIFKHINLIPGQEQAIREGIHSSTYEQNNAWHILPAINEEELQKRLQTVFIDPEIIYKQTLHSACDIATALLDFGVDVNSQDQWGRTALHYAIFSNNREMAGLLLQRGANPNITEERNQTPTDLAVANPKMLRLLLKFGANVNAVRRSLLLRAVDGQHLESVQILLKYRADVNIANQQGQTPLHFAVEMGCSEIISKLLDYKADINRPDKSGSTPIFACCDDENLAAMLIKRGASVNLINHAGETPLHIAASKGKCRAIRALLKAGAFPKVADAAGKTPLKRAEESGHLEAMQLLGMDINSGYCFGFVRYFI